MEANKLFDRIYGALIGSAIGDAMGGPVEGLHFTEIAERYGRVDSLLPYSEVTPSYHGPFSKEAGAYTDDTRISILLGKAALHAGGLPKKGDITHVLAEYYFTAESDMERGFIEEYYLKGIYGDEKEVFGGRPTNGGIMGIASLGAIFPASPKEAFAHVFKNLYLSTGTARTASAFAAAMIAAAMQPEITWQQIMEEAFQACGAYKREIEASGWRNSNLYPVVAVKSEQMVRTAVEMGAGVASVDDLRQQLYDALVQPFFADGSESLALAAAMFCAARGDFAETVIGCVNFGRDNDSSAAVGGAVAGALHGASAIKQEWIDLIEKVNPAPSLKSLAEKLTGLTMRRYRSLHTVACNQQQLFFGVAAEEGQQESDLVSAAHDGAWEKVLEFLNNGIQPDAQGQDGKTAMHIAAASGSADAMSMLLLFGADPNARDENETTPLHFAAWKNQLTCVRILLDNGTDADLAEGEGWTAIHDALRKEYADIVVEILTFSRQLNQPQSVLREIEEKTGDTRFLAMLKLLQANQVQLGSVGICGQSLLHDAVERGYQESTAYLIEQEVDVNRLATQLWNTRYEGTPLHKAAAFGHKKIYEMLVAAGADEHIVNIDGKTAPELMKKSSEGQG